MNNKVLDIIIAFIKGSKENDNRVAESIDNRYYAIGNSWYLLGQIIRGYCIDNNHFYISELAIEKWNEISNEPIFKYWYRDNVTVEKDNNIEIHEYVGNSKNYTTKHLKKGDNFVFRNVFHDEHMVPVKMILDELISLDDPNYENVSQILDKMYICRMLKDEDRSIKNKYNRSTDVNEVIKNDYKDIKIRKLEAWDQIF